MFQKPKSPDMTQLAGAALLNAVGGQQSEHIEYSVHTQAWVPLVQTALLVLSLAACLCGVGLLLSGVAWLARAIDDPALLVMAAIALTVAGYGVLGGELWLQRKLKPKLAPSLLLTTGFVVADVIAVALLLDLLRLVVAWSPWLALTIAGGLALVVAPCFLIWRIGNELVNPTYPRGPMIDMMMKWLGTSEGQTVRVREPVPVRLNNGDPVLVDLPVNGESDMGPDFRDLLAFVTRAEMIGLSRARWLDRNNPERLPGGQVTRPRYNEMIAMAADWGIVSLGGEGRATEWAMPASEALDRLMDAWDEVKGQ